MLDSSSDSLIKLASLQCVRFHKTVQREASGRSPVVMSV